MSTTIKPELSKKNKFWIERHRYYELKHFCLQYPGWKKTLSNLEFSIPSPNDPVRVAKTNNISDPVAKLVEARLFYANRIEMIERIAEKVDADISKYIVKGVTEGLSYDVMAARYQLPCSKDTYYDRYREFFFLLSRERK